MKKVLLVALSTIFVGVAMADIAEQRIFPGSKCVREENGLTLNKIPGFGSLISGKGILYGETFTISAQCDESDLVLESIYFSNQDGLDNSIGYFEKLSSLISKEHGEVTESGFMPDSMSTPDPDKVIGGFKYSKWESSNYFVSLMLGSDLSDSGIRDYAIAIMFKNK